MIHQSTARTKLWLLGLGALPLLAVWLHINTIINVSESLEEAEAARAIDSQHFVAPACEFPGRGDQGKRLLYVLVDSLRWETATNPEVMPWLGELKRQSLHGAMRPCMAQLTTPCVRTQFEGVEPNFVLGFKNFTGSRVKGPNLLGFLAGRGVRSAMVANHSLVSLYEDDLVEKVVAEQFVADEMERDVFIYETALRWLNRPDLDVVFVYFVGTDTVAHRFPVDGAVYRSHYRMVDGFLADLARQMGPADTLIIAGDHGHDLKGYHSAGIDSQTTYFARGPFFPPGREQSIDSASMLYLLSAATCQSLSPLYAGQDLGASLTLPPAYAQAWNSAHAGRDFPSDDAGEVTRASLQPPLYYWPLGILFMLALFLQAVRAWDGGVQMPDKIVFGFNLALVACAFHLPVLLLLLLAIVANTGFVLGGILDQKLIGVNRSGFIAACLASCLALEVFLGATSHVFLVAMQSHVRPLWYVYVIAAVVVLSLAGSHLLQRWSPTISFGERAALIGWVIVFFGLFLGPYYYGSARWLLTAITLWLLASGWRHLRVDRTLLRRAIVSALLVLPLHAPVMKAWKLRYPLLSFADQLPFAAVVFIIVGLALAAGWLLVDRRGWQRTVPAVIFLVALGVLVEFSHAAMIAGSLVYLSYRGWSLYLDVVAAPAAKSCILSWLRPALQATYAFMLFFAMFRGLLFFNVDFAFAFKAAPSRWPTHQIVVVVGLLTVVKYLAPLVPLFWTGGKLSYRSYLIIFFKMICLMAFYAGMEIVNHPSSAMFSRVLGQEIMLWAVLYLGVLVSAVVAWRPAAEKLPSGAA